MFAYYSNTLPSIDAAKMDFGKMKEGDIAGIVVFQDPYAYIGVQKENGQNYNTMVNNGKTIDSSGVKGSTIYLRASAMLGSGAALMHDRDAVHGSGGVSSLYSTDNKSFVTVGNELTMRFNLKIFAGNKFCLFKYATKEIGGYVDFDWFRTDCKQVLEVMK